MWRRCRTEEEEAAAVCADFEWQLLVPDGTVSPIDLSIICLGAVSIVPQVLLVAVIDYNKENNQPEC